MNKSMTVGHLWAHLWFLVLYLKLGGGCGVDFFSCSTQPHGGSRECGEGWDLLELWFCKASCVCVMGGRWGKGESC